MVRLDRDKKAALVSIVVTAFLVVIKYTIGILSGSIALIADAVHSFTDVISSIGVVIKNPFITLEKRKGLKAAELLVAHKIDKLVTKESIAKKSPFYVLEDAYVVSDVTDADTIGEAIDNLSLEKF